MTPERLDQLSKTSLGLPLSSRIGISCTGAALLRDWVRPHPAKKLILHRDFDEINDSLMAIGLRPFTADTAAAFARHLGAISGLHLHYSNIFDAAYAAEAWDYLELPGQFSAGRHAEMCRWHVEPKYDDVTLVEPDAAKVFMDRIRAAM